MLLCRVLMMEGDTDSWSLINNYVPNGGGYIFFLSVCGVFIDFQIKSSLQKIYVCCMSFLVTIFYVATKSLYKDSLEMGQYHDVRYPYQYFVLSIVDTRYHNGLYRYRSSILFLFTSCNFIYSVLYNGIRKNHSTLNMVCNIMKCYLIRASLHAIKTAILYYSTQ